MLKRRTSSVLVPFALCATGLVLLFSAGCRKEEPQPAVDPSSPSSYMNDPAFRQQLKERRKAAASIGEARAKVAARMDEMTKIMGEKLKTADRAKVVAELGKLAEWRDLEAKAKAIDAEFERHRRETLRLVRERIAPKKVSK